MGFRALHFPFRDGYPHRPSFAKGTSLGLESCSPSLMFQRIFMSVTLDIIPCPYSVLANYSERDTRLINACSGADGRPIVYK
jgi:hypothetical protein